MGRPAPLHEARCRRCRPPTPAHPNSYPLPIKSALELRDDVPQQRRLARAGAAREEDVGARHQHRVGDGRLLGAERDVIGQLGRLLLLRLLLLLLLLLPLRGHAL